MHDTHGSRVMWTDPKRYLWSAALVMPLLPFVAVVLHASTGRGVWLWLGPIVILGVVPIVDLVTGSDPSSPPDEALAHLEQDRYYRWVIYAFLPLQYAGFLVAMAVIARGNLLVSERIGLAVTVGFIGGLGINAAHELGHKRQESERWLARVALAQSAYGHFYVEHNRGHHVRVATPDDPASARLGESFYAFWPRTVAGSFLSAWHLEERRLARGGRGPWRWGNEVVAGWLLTLGLYAVVIAWLGLTVVPYLLLQALVGLTLLEAVNYLEHYGLRRQRVGTGERERWERVEPRHSWNSNHITTNVLLYHLQRHSDHHAAPTRRYQALRDDPSAPALPTGYGGMILLALVPPLWRAVMDQRVVAHYNGDIRCANLSPRLQRAYAGVASPSPWEPSERQAAAGRPGPGGDRLACPGCGYVYDVRAGAPREGFAPGTAWGSVPDDWVCPDCGVRDKADFVAVT